MSKRKRRMDFAFHALNVKTRLNGLVPLCNKDPANVKCFFPLICKLMARKK